jgi:hypothetical protein
MIKFSDIQDAFYFVGSASYGMHTAVLNNRTGRIYCRSEMGDLDDISDADIDWEQCIEIPHKNDLKLGRELVYDFVVAHLPDEYDRVVDYFHGPGAYRLYKELLHSKGLLQTWYSYENKEEDRALREWCTENGIEISG